jgi:hypothetical protein
MASSIRKTAQTATLLGYDDDAKQFFELHSQLKRQFIAEFYHSDKHDFGSQGANVLALAYGLFPAEDETKITSQWHRDGDKILWSFTIPPNTTATVYTSSDTATEYTAGSYTVVLSSSKPEGHPTKQ